MTYNIILVHINAKIVKKLRTELNNKVNKLPLNYFDSTSLGNTLSRIANDTDTLSDEGAFAGGIVFVINETLLLIGLIIAMFITS
jgi:ATP-binding cassette subfamily B protein